MLRSVETTTMTEPGLQIGLRRIYRTETAQELKTAIRDLRINRHGVMLREMARVAIRVTPRQKETFMIVSSEVSKRSSSFPNNLFVFDRIGWQKFQDGQNIETIQATGRRGRVLPMVLSANIDGHVILGSQAAFSHHLYQPGGLVRGRHVALSVNSNGHVMLDCLSDRGLTVHAAWPSAETPSQISADQISAGLPQLRLVTNS